MDTDIHKARKLVNFMRKNGVLALKLEGMELQIAQSALISRKRTRYAADPEEAKPKQSEATEEEALYWSAPNNWKTEDLS